MPYLHIYKHENRSYIEQSLIARSFEIKNDTELEIRAVKSINHD